MVVNDDSQETEIDRNKNVTEATDIDQPVRKHFLKDTYNTVQWITKKW